MHGMAHEGWRELILRFDSFVVSNSYNRIVFTIYNELSFISGNIITLKAQICDLAKGSRISRRARGQSSDSKLQWPDSNRPEFIPVCCQVEHWVSLAPNRDAAKRNVCRELLYGHGLKV